MIRQSSKILVTIFKLESDLSVLPVTDGKWKHVAVLVYQKICWIKN